MNSIRYGKKAVPVFFFVVICLSAVAEFLICSRQFMWGYPVLMWMPALAAVIASVVSIRESGSSFSPRSLFPVIGIHRCKIRYIAAGFLIPLVYLLIPYLIYWTMHPENFAYSGVAVSVILRDCLPAGIIGVFVGLLTATGEEIGWRGFLVPALHEKIGLHGMLLVTGLFWCLWHFPLLIWDGYMEGASLAYSLISFVLCIFPVGAICALLRLESGSMWPCAFLHAAHNNYDQAIFGVITNGADKMYYVSETGVFTMVCVWVIAIVMYISFRRKRGLAK